MTACKICEAPDAEFMVRPHHYLCFRCTAHPVLVQAFSEGLARLSGTEIVLVPKAQ